MTQFDQVRPNDGFDRTPVPRWAMVPVGGSKSVKLRLGANMTVVSLNTGVLTVAEAPSSRVASAERVFVLTGVLTGNTFIEARNGATVAARLQLTVKNRRTITVTFNFVNDGAGHRTHRHHGVVDGFVREMNGIFLPQANVQIQKHAVRTVAIPGNLGPVIRFSAHLPAVPVSEHEWPLLVARRDATASLNVFFVWEYESDATPNIDNVDGATQGGVCVMEDHAGTDVGESLAHEMGHHLGLADTYASTARGLLMYGYTDVRGRRLRQSDVNTINP